MNIKGIIKRITEINQVSDSFKKRELHLSMMDGEYEQIICIEFQQDNCSKLDGLKVGSEISIDCNLRGREWQKDEQSPVKVFNTIVGWKIGNIVEEEPTAAQMGDDVPY